MPRLWAYNNGDDQMTGFDAIAAATDDASLMAAVEAISKAHDMPAPTSSWDEVAHENIDSNDPIKRSWARLLLAAADRWREITNY